MICILHGYLLEGSGSNLWTRAVITSLCRQGETVHLFCQENHPEMYDFISEAYAYDATLQKLVLFQRESPYKGRCILHKPWIGETLPVYVWDKYEEYSDVRPMTELSDEEIEVYIQRNLSCLKKIINENDIRVLHANHAVLMSVVARRIYSDLGLSYSIMPHGSAIEYAVKKDARLFALAEDAFAEAKRIFVIGKEIRQRVAQLFPSIPDIEKKMVHLNLGVDTALFKPIEPSERRQNIERLCRQIEGMPRGRSRQQSSDFFKQLHTDLPNETLRKIIAAASDYNGKRTDEDAEEKLLSVDWQKEKIILYVGRIISGKGVHSIITALPPVLKRYPQTRLVVVGHGPLREPLEAFLWALRNGDKELAWEIIRHGRALEGVAGEEVLKESEYYLQNLKEQGKLEAYFADAAEHLKEDTVVFTGYLTHNELRYLFPASDVAIFPSVVAEAGPLVFLEAMASGCFPIGTYFAGMAASIDSTEGYVSEAIQNLMKLRPEPQHTVSDLVANIQGALNLDPAYRQALRSLAVEKYDWSSISRRFNRELKDMAG